MQFIDLYAALLGLVALASAIPRQPDVGALDRRMKWAPRSNVEVVNLKNGGNNNKGNVRNGNENGNGNNSGGDRSNGVVIIDTTVVALNRQSRNSEVELIILLQERMRRDR